jgi:glycosyltransferase involved in cell wall biosynthesis
MSRQRLRVLFVVEGCTDIRFVVGLSEVCELSMVVPAAAFASSGLRERLQASNARVAITEIEGCRLAFSARVFGFLWRHAARFDVIIAQEAMRGALGANLAGRLRSVPVVNTLALPPVEYFRCRWERRSIRWWRYCLGDTVIRALLAVNGRLASAWLALGPYLQDVARRHACHIGAWAYYGVDTEYFQPAIPAEKRALRQRLALPADAFLICLASRISHEKDPETALQAVAQARQSGLNAVLLNLGGGYQEFLALAQRLQLPQPAPWVLARPAAHPMRELADYYRAADVVVQSSLEEGLGLSPLEALACGIPVVATAVGGMAAQLPGRAHLTPRQDPAAMAERLQWIAAHPEEARAQALRARESYVVPQWNRGRAFHDLEATLRQVVKTVC